MSRGSAARLGAGVVAMVVSLSACELTEVTVPRGEPRLVVQAVMRPDQSRQWVLVEETLVGQPVLTDGSERVPVTNAIITVDNLTRASPAFCSGGTREFLLADADLGNYQSFLNCPLLRGGDVLELVVRVGAEGLVTGTLRVPSIGRFTTFINGEAQPDGTDRITINRDTDTLRFTVDKLSGRGLLVESQSLSGLAQIDRRFSFFVDTTSVRLFGNLLSDFDDDGEQLFRAGRFSTISVALMDENMFRFVTTRSDPITGRGFDNRLEGGIGVFGAVDPRFVSVRAAGTIDDPREGMYHLEGQVGGANVALDLELYLVDNLENAEFSAFVTGTWPGFGQQLSTSMDGTFAGNSFSAALDLSITSDNVFLMSAADARADAFQINVRDLQDRPIGSLQVTR